MKQIVTEVSPVISSGSQSSQSYSIRKQDMPIILDILRSKMYKDPIKALVREVCANARDANREVGTPDRPIKIVLPTFFSKQIEIQDFGPGISPERMSDIFLNFGASTKRDSNEFTGFFGMGSKSPFSYSDTFSVKTIVDGVERFYTAIIDESKTGRMDLLQEIKTNESNGTTIIVPVRDIDFSKFSNAVIDVCEYWNEKYKAGIRPIVHNLSGDYDFPEAKEPDLQGNDWDFFFERKKKKNQGFSYSKANIIIDGIKYEISTNDISDDRSNSYLNMNFDIYFPTGLIELSSNRDTIHFNDNTKNIILNKIKEIRAEIKKITLAKLQTFEFINEAEVFLSKINGQFGGYSFPLDDGKSILWKGNALSGARRSLKENMHISVYEKRYVYRSGTKKIKRTNQNNIEFYSNHFIYAVDKPIKSQNKIVEKIFEKHGENIIVSIISFDDKLTKDKFFKATDFKYVKSFSVFDLPELEKKEKEPKTKFAKPISFSGYKYGIGYRQHITFDSILDVDNVYIETDNINNTSSFLIDGQKYSEDIVNFITSHLKISVYSLNYKNTKHLGPKWKNVGVELKKYLNSEAYANLLVTSDVAHNIYTQIYNYQSSKAYHTLLNILPKNYIKNSSKSSVIYKVFKKYNDLNMDKLTLHCVTYNYVIASLENFYDKDKPMICSKDDVEELVSLITECEDTYPLLTDISGSQSKLEYVELVDKYNNLKEKSEK